MQDLRRLSAGLISALRRSGQCNELPHAIQQLQADLPGIVVGICQESVSYLACNRTGIREDRLCQGKAKWCKIFADNRIY